MLLWSCTRDVIKMTDDAVKMAVCNSLIKRLRVVLFRVVFLSRAFIK